MKPWEQMENEPDLWYGRFHDNYMLLGTERTLDAAFRHFWAGAQSGDNPGHRRRPRRMTGSWREAARKWEWAKRARAFDEDERRRIRKIHFEAVKKMNERHQLAARAVFNKVIAVLQSLKLDALTPLQIISVLERIIMLERRVMGEPIGIQITHKGAQFEDEPGYDDALQEASAENVARFDATPEMYAAVVQVLEAQETRSYEEDVDAAEGAVLSSPALPQAELPPPTTVEVE